MERLSKLDSLGGWIAAATFVVFATMAADVALAQGLASSKHNLGTGGTGGVHVTTGTSEICVFCHTPHGGQIGTAPLWNKNLPSTTYQLYGSTGGESATLDGQVLVVGSVSQACLSCHDGTQAMDNMVNAPGSGGFSAGGARPNAGAGYTWTAAVAGTGVMPAGVTNLSGDLRNDHPIGVQYCGGGPTVASPTTACRDPDFVAPQNGTPGGGAIAFWVDTTGGGAGTREKTDMILYKRTFTVNGGEGPSVECGSCHDPHNNTNPTFLRIANTGSALCLSCHVK
jgi:predicted CXXCH cytochrome family protein